jgi:hypothetical protein
MAILQQQRLLGGAIGVAICSSLLQSELPSPRIETEDSGLEDINRYREAFAAGFGKQTIAISVASALALVLTMLLLERRPRRSSNSNSNSTPTTQASC